jgi:DNA invertase Pin-like site-specific DNA recombinase
LYASSDSEEASMAKAKRTARVRDADPVAAAEAAARLAAGAPETPPEGHGAPPPAAGDGQGSAPATKNQRRVALYLRVSTNEQTIENQERDLREVADRAGWQIVRIYKDNGISGAKGRDRRPALDAMLRAVTRREFHMVMAWGVDRLGRSLQDLVATLNEMRASGCDLFLLRQNVDTSTPSGRAMFQMMGVFAEFEREMIRDRVISGMSRARSEGKVMGRPRVPAEKVDAIRAELARGNGINKTARLHGVGVLTVQRIKREKAGE